MALYKHEFVSEDKLKRHNKQYQFLSNNHSKYLLRIFAIFITQEQDYKNRLYFINVLFEYPSNTLHQDNQLRLLTKRRWTQAELVSLISQAIYGLSILQERGFRPLFNIEKSNVCYFSRDSLENIKLMVFSNTELNY